MEDKLKKIGILTDTVSDLPDDIAAKYGIEVIPLKIHIDDKTYLAKKDITDEQFFEMLSNTNTVAKTSQPSPYEFQVAYEKMLDAYERVLSIHASTELSGTFQSAQIAKDTLEGKLSDRITLFDTGQASMGEGLIVVKAAEMAEAGEEESKIIKELERISKVIKTRFVPDTLKYLERGGRIGKASAFLGNILSIKPLLGVDKIVYPVEKVRGGKNVVPKLLEQLGSSLKAADRFRACILSSNMPEEEEQLRKAVSSDGRVVDIMDAKLGSVIGCHVGPKVIGLVWYTL